MRKIDAGRIAKGVARPGMDTRIWFALGTIKELGFDAVEGIFADVVIQPEGTVETCYVGSNYAGNSFGDHNPLEVDDTVVIGIPMGDSNHGPIIISRFHNSGDPPAPQMASGTEPSKDRVIVVKPGQKLQIFVSQGGEVDITTDGASMTIGPAAAAIKAPMVDLGEAPTTGVATFTSMTPLMTLLTNFVTMVNNIVGTPNAAGLAAGVDPSGSLSTAVTGAATPLLAALPAPTNFSQTVKAAL